MCFPAVVGGNTRHRLLFPFEILIAGDNGPQICVYPATGGCPIDVCNHKRNKRMGSRRVDEGNHAEIEVVAECADLIVVVKQTGDDLRREDDGLDAQRALSPSAVNGRVSTNQ